MARAMSTLVAGPRGRIVTLLRARMARSERPEPARPPAVLAPTLPALLLVGLCIAGMSDPPAVAGPGSRLHVPPVVPQHAPAVPLGR